MQRKVKGQKVREIVARSSDATAAEVDPTRPQREGEQQSRGPPAAIGLQWGTTGARVVVTGNNGTSVTLTPNSAGNFSSSTTLSPPYMAKVVNAVGVERVMSSTASSGDCNLCHTQTGASGAPGRVTLPP